MTFHCAILSTSKTSADVPPNKAIHTERKWRSDFSLKFQITRAISARRSKPLDAGKDERNSTMANPLAVAGDRIRNISSQARCRLDSLPVCGMV